MTDLVPSTPDGGDAAAPRDQLKLQYVEQVQEDEGNCLDSVILAVYLRERERPRPKERDR
jgi:hypothetical protein